MKFRRGAVAAAKLSPTEVLEIRRKYAYEGYTQGRLSREYKVGVGTIGRIVRGESWQQYQQIEHPQETQHHDAAAETIVLTPAQLADMEAGLARLLAVEAPRSDPAAILRDKGREGLLTPGKEEIVLTPAQTDPSEQK